MHYQYQLDIVMLLSWPKTDEYKIQKSSGDNLKGKNQVTLITVYQITGTKSVDSFKYVRKDTQIFHVPIVRKYVTNARNKD